MAAQTIHSARLISGLEWIVVDDGATPTKLNQGQILIRPHTVWQLGQNTQGRNLQLGLTAASGDLIAFIEDDDYYSPAYLEVLVRGAIKYNAALIGGNSAVYYHLPTKRYKFLDNLQHASLCSTIMRSDLVPLFSRVLQNPSGQFFDMQLWHSEELDNDETKRRLLCPSSSLCVGVKGLPGRAGIGMGHRPPDNWRVDADLKIAQSLFKTGFDAYLPYLSH